METERAPWVFAIITAIWFGWMARRAGRSSTLWVVGGGAFALVISTLVVGLGHATSIPFSDHERIIQQAKWIAAAAIVVLILGWLLTSSLHRHHLLIWRALNPELRGDASAVPGKPGPITATKPPLGKGQI